MSDYQRLYVPGGTYFFTVVTHERQRLFVTALRVKELRQAFHYVNARRPFAVVAAVVLPDHLHCLWQLPDGDCDFSTRWQMIKTEFSRHVPAPVKRDGSKTIWQPRYWEHVIRDEEDFRRHLDYIHYNPVKHGLVSAPAAWPYSSFRRFVRMHWYDADWARKSLKTCLVWNVSELAGLCRERPAALSPAYAGEDVPGTACGLIPAYERRSPVKDVCGVELPALGKA